MYLELSTEPTIYTLMSKNILGGNFSLISSSLLTMTSVARGGRGRQLFRFWVKFFLLSDLIRVGWRRVSMQILILGQFPPEDVLIGMTLLGPGRLEASPSANTNHPLIFTHTESKARASL